MKHRTLSGVEIASRAAQAPSKEGQHDSRAFQLIQSPVWRITRRGICMYRAKGTFTALLLAAVALLCSTVAHAQGNSEAAKLRQLNNQLLHLHGQLNAAINSNGNSLHSQASAVIAERFAALQALIEEDPETALEFGFDGE